MPFTSFERVERALGRGETKSSVPLTFTPTKDPAGRFYEISGTGTLEPVIAALAPQNLPSPAGNAGDWTSGSLSQQIITDTREAA
jgi:hypothetical protein